MAMMITDLESKTKEIYAAMSAHDVEKFVSFHTPDIVVESVPDGSLIKGLDEVRAMTNGYLTAFKDFKMELTSVFASGNRQCEEWVVTGTHTGAYQGLPASGKKVSFRGILVRELKDGKTCRVTNYFDSASMIRQMT